MTRPHALTGPAALCLAIMLLPACTGQREPAQKIMNDIQAAVAVAAADAAKYAPDQLNDVETKLDDLKTAFDAQDFNGVLTRGPAILGEAEGLAGAAAATKADTNKALNDQWDSLAGTVPDELTEIHGRIDVLGQPGNRRLAKGIDLEAARAGIDAATSQWSKAQGAFGNGNLDEAVAAGKDAKNKVDTVSVALKTPVVPR